MNKNVVFMVIANRKIEIAEEDAMDIYLLLVEKNDEILEDMLTTKDLEKKKEFIKNSFKVHEKIELIAHKLGLDL